MKQNRSFLLQHVAYPIPRKMNFEVVSYCSSKCIFVRIVFLFVYFFWLLNVMFCEIPLTASPVRVLHINLTLVIHVDSLLLTPNKLHPPGCASDGSGDELWYAASHERSERHQQQQTASDPRHHRTDPPLHARDALKARVAPALLQHDGGLPLLIPDGIRTAAECSERHGLTHLRAQQPVGHEESHTRGSRAQQRHQRPDHPCVCQTGCHAGEIVINITSKWVVDKQRCHKTIPFPGLDVKCLSPYSLHHGCHFCVVSPSCQRNKTVTRIGNTR